MSLILKQPTVLPGFGLTLGFTLFYLSLIVLIPLAGLFVKTSAERLLLEQQFDSTKSSISCMAFLSPQGLLFSRESLVEAAVPY